MPDIYGVISHSHTTYNGGTQISGAFAAWSAVGHNMRTGDAGTTHYTSDFLASRYNPIYSASTVTPLSMTTSYFIRF